MATLKINMAGAVAERPSPAANAPTDPRSARPVEEEPMTEAQVDALRRLAHEALEPEAFSRRLSRREAQRRIDALAAKLRLQDGPPHTL